MNLEDIAKQAGVSRSTVSRVINNENNVSAATRARVLEVVNRLNYTPNHAARTLVTQRSGVFGVVLPNAAQVFFNADSAYFPMLLQGIAEAAYQHDQSMLLWLGQPNEEPERFSQRVIRSRLYDGLIIGSIEDDNPLIVQLVESVRHFVMVERPLHYADRVSYVSPDNVQAGRMATEHFLQLGYTRVAHLTGQMNIADAQDRLMGYQQALANAGVPYNPDLVYHGRFDRDAGYDGMKALLPHKPDAVFIASDTAALGAMRALDEAGLRVPHDIALIGFDDLDIAAKATPPLTSVRQPIQEKGAAAVNLLLDLIDGKVEGPQRIILPTQLVIRDSCGATLSGIR